MLLVFTITLIALYTTSTPHVLATVVGHGLITTHPYNPSMPLPACQIPYTCLDVSRITAIQTLDKRVDCGTCLKVVNSNNPARFVHVLAVDLGGRGLDLSTPAFVKLFGKSILYPVYIYTSERNRCNDGGISCVMVTGASQVLSRYFHTKTPRGCSHPRHATGHVFFGVSCYLFLSHFS